MSDTPRTDAVTEHYYTQGGLRSASVVRADFARELERELAAAIKQRDEARREVFNALKELYTTAGLRRELVRRGWWEWYKEVRP
jgi:hypothetical protein